MFQTHEKYMKIALRLAERGRYSVSPNPMVGCLIVNNDEVVGQGYHQQAGGPHAEIIALAEAKQAAKGATAYVTLEPCCHYGRTPPCINELIRTGIKKIFVACEDPNPKVAGKGIQALIDAGIEVELGLLEAEAKNLNAIFFHFIQHKRPFIISKWAMSLDGKTVTHPSDSRDISNSKSRHSTHFTRMQVDAILVGANTAICDDPLLTVRLPEMTPDQIKQPIRIILATRLLPSTLKIFATDTPGKTIIVTSNKANLALANDHVEIILMPVDANNYINLPMLCEELGRRDITSLLVEGGIKVRESFFQSNLVNQVQLYLAPVIIGNMEKKIPVTHLQTSTFDSDHFFTGDIGVTHV